MGAAPATFTGILRRLLTAVVGAVAARHTRPEDPRADLRRDRRPPPRTSICPACARISATHSATVRHWRRSWRGCSSPVSSASTPSPKVYLCCWMRPRRRARPEHCVPRAPATMQGAVKMIGADPRVLTPPSAAAYFGRRWVRSSAAEHRLHTAGVTGSNPCRTHHRFSGDCPIPTSRGQKSPTGGPVAKVGWCAPSTSSLRHRQRRA